jgi:DNA-binding protein HU-beta
MTKAEFVELVQKTGRFSNKGQAKKAVDAFILSIMEALSKKESVTFVGFGTFSTIEVAEKSGTVPGTDKRYTKPAHTAPKFKFGKLVKDAVAK